MNKYIVDSAEENTKLNLLHIISGMSENDFEEKFLRECIEYLLDQPSVDVNYVGVVHRNYGITAAHIAVQYHNKLILSLLIRHGADLLICDSYGKNVQDYAELEDSPELVTMVEKGIFDWIEQNRLKADYFNSNLETNRNASQDSLFELSSSLEELLKLSQSLSFSDQDKSSIYSFNEKSPELEIHHCLSPISKLIPDKVVETPSPIKHPADCFFTPEVSFKEIRSRFEKQTTPRSPEIIDLSSESVKSTKPDSDCSFEKLQDGSFESQATEVYVYKDNQNGIELIEERFEALRVKDDSQEHESCDSSLDRSIDSFILKLTNSQLSAEMHKKGQSPGPVNAKTRKLYERKLNKMKHRRSTSSLEEELEKEKKLEASLHLLCNYPIEYNMFVKRSFPFNEAIEYENKLIQYYENSSNKSKQTHFIYLLIDPNISQNLPARANLILDPFNPTSLADLLIDIKLFSSFILSIFYVGKGQSNRAYQHFYDAFNAKRNTNNKRVVKLSAKIEKIHSIWSTNRGPVSLHCFTGISSEEAFARESLIIEALSLTNLTNQISGRQCEVSLNKRQRSILGTYLLFKAFVILLLNGERQIRQPSDVGYR